MAKMWAGRTAGSTNKSADELNSSIGVDCRMYKQDIEGSKAHALMLGKQGIIAESDAEAIIAGLNGILADLESGKLAIDMEAEDIHMFVEQVLTERIGDTGKKLHTARSRNDQVALDTRLYLADEAANIVSQAKMLMSSIADKAEANIDVVMPGYTHLQHAQPILFSHHIMAYAMMLSRDVERIEDAIGRMKVSPIGSCALAGTTYDTDRYFEAKTLGLDEIAMNSIDGVSDRDFCVEFLSDLALVMMHLSRFSEEIILWASQEFGFIELSDGYTTGSSIMPQKKNPDMAELCRGKTGRVYGDLMALLTTLKGLPLAYNKDMQEDKEMVFDALDTVKLCLTVFTEMFAEMSVKPEVMFAAAQKGFMNATDLADYMVKKGMPFRDAYKISGKLVAECIERNCILETLPLDDYRKHSDLIEEDVYKYIDLKTCVETRISAGGTSTASVKAQIEYIRSIAK